jgi:peptide/nickel transport system permease protein
MTKGSDLLVAALENDGVERIFGIPGIGALMVDAAFARDYGLVQACALTFLICVLMVNFLVDSLCAALNPRSA